MAIGFAGVLMILRPTPASFEVASIFAVLATLGFSGRDLATSVSPKTMSANQLGTLGFIVLIVAGFVLLPFQGLPQAMPMEPLHLATVALTTLVGVVAYNTLTIAMRTGDIAVVTPFRYSRMLFALVFAIYWFGERPDILTLAGTALIMVQAAYTR